MKLYVKQINKKLLSVVLILTIIFNSTSQLLAVEVTDPESGESFSHDLRTSFHDHGICGATWTCLKAPIYAARSCGINNLCCNPCSEGGLLDLTDSRTLLSIMNLIGIGISFGADAVISQIDKNLDKDATISDVQGSVNALYALNNIDKARMIAIVALLTIDKLKGKKVNLAIAKTITGAIDLTWNIIIDGLIKNTLRCFCGTSCVGEDPDWSINLRNFDEDNDSDENEMSPGALTNQYISTTLSLFSFISKMVIIGRGLKPSMNDSFESRAFISGLFAVNAFTNIDIVMLLILAFFIADS